MTSLGPSSGGAFSFWNESANCFATVPTVTRSCSPCVQGPAFFSRKAGPFSTQRGSKLETIQGDQTVKVAFTPAQFYLFPHVAACPPGRVHRAVLSEAECRLSATTC